VGVADNAAFGRSLWLAADSFDLGGERDQAIALFNDYAKFFPGDPRQPEARYRLARAYQSRGEYGTASEVYRGLVADGKGSGTNAGPFADASLVPLAQCLLMDAAPENDDEAQGLLLEVIEGKSGSVNTPQYRQALVVLASVKARKGEYAGAIQHLEEAAQRFTDDPEISTLLYNLADAHRLDAKAIARTLTEALPDSRKQLLTETRQARLRRAMELFDRVRTALEGKDARRLSALERLQLRNSSFFVGDCAFELRDFDGAIRRYDAAREKYPQDPASMVAMIQIVNGYVEQGDLARAATAQQRAVMFYKSMPPTAWNDPDLPMTREDWQRWLDSMKALKPLGESAPVVEVPPKTPKSASAGGSQP
jgi:TolA-binding protein